MIRQDNHQQPGERVVLFPGYGRFSPHDKSWRIHVRGAVFDPHEVKLRRRIMLRLLRLLLTGGRRQFEADIFRRRVEAFAASSGRGRKVAIRIGDRRYPLAEGSHRCGRFGGTIHVLDRELGALGSFSDSTRKLDVEVECQGSKQVHCAGTVHLINPHGWSVVSDIDDTIKHTNVASRRELLANTFLREFRCVDGMSAVYRRFDEFDAAFHYVSSSPWQLYLPLAELVEQAGFPAGSFHLRSFRLRDAVLKGVGLHRIGKSVEIRHLVEAFPHRRFVLVGDSGEHDPEIYAKLAEQFPQQIKAVFIRQLAEKPIDPLRKKRLCERLAPNIIRTFESPDELGETCERLMATSFVDSP